MSILILPNRLRLLTLPKTSLPSVTHALLRSLFFPVSRDTLFSYTENALEISIVADIATVEHFDSNCPGLRVSSDIFRALQIDNEYGLDNAGRRINELSGPLAQAGISIFYLSTYQTDLVFVKEKRLPMVVRALKDWNFTDLSSLDRQDYESTNGGSPQGHRKFPSVGNNGAVHTAVRSPKSLSPPIPIPIGMSHSPTSGLQIAASHTSTSSLTDGYFHLASSFSPTFEMAPVRVQQMTQAESDRMMNEVRRLTKREVLGRTLRLCGLNRDYTESWALKLIRVLLYPDLLGQESHDRFFSYTLFEEGISLVADESVIASTFEDHHINVSPRPLSCIQVDLDQFGLDRFGIVFSMSDPLTRHAINLLYLSTYRTANVLVSSKDLPRAMAILDEMSVMAEQEQEHGRSVGEGSESVSVSISDRTNGRESFGSHNLAAQLGVSADSEAAGHLNARYHSYDEDDEEWRGKANIDEEEIDFDDQLPPGIAQFSISLGGGPGDQA